VKCFAVRSLFVLHSLCIHFFFFIIFIFIFIIIVIFLFLFLFFLSSTKHYIWEGVDGISQARWMPFKRRQLSDVLRCVVAVWSLFFLHSLLCVFFLFFHHLHLHLRHCLFLVLLVPLFCFLSSKKALRRSRWNSTGKRDGWRRKPCKRHWWSPFFLHSLRVSSSSSSSLKTLPYKPKRCVLQGIGFCGARAV